MKVGKKQTIYGLVLGVAAAGFVVDRLFFTPASAEAVAPRATAAAPAVSAAPPATAGAAMPAGAMPAIPAGWLAERLKAATSDSDNDLRDVFAVPASWKPAPKAVAADLAPKAKLLGDQFRSGHHLEAVVIEGRKSLAVVDGQLVSLGGSIDGFQLVSLGRQSARFVHDNEQVSLALPGISSPAPH